MFPRLTATDTPQVTADIEQILREVRRVGPGQDDTFTVRDMSQIISTMTSTSTLLTGLLSAVAGVSLLVGGIGIMNIMLVSVTERTREIGIRLAIGALERQVLTQFLVEALVLALMGGVIGIMLGLGLAGIAVPFHGHSLRAKSLDHHARLPVLRRHRPGLWILPGQARRKARPDRRAAA